MVETVKTAKRTRSGFSLIELLVVILILGILTMISLPVYITTVQSSQQATANSNARALATAVQAHAQNNSGFDTAVTDYASDMGGSIPLNPCTGTAAGYIISATAHSATVSALPGSNCGSWTPAPFTVNR